MARAWYTHVVAPRLSRRIRHFSGKVSRAAVADPEAVLGLEHHARLQSTLTSANKRIMFQIELIGLSRIGSNPLQILRNNVPRYQLLHQDETPPSRFTTYE